MPHFKLFRLLFTCIPEKLGERKDFIMSFAFNALMPPQETLLGLQRSGSVWNQEHFHHLYKGFKEQLPFTVTVSLEKDIICKCSSSKFPQQVVQALSAFIARKKN